jgi:hypothetical protein
VHLENTSFVDNVVYTADITGIPEPTMSLGLLGFGALLVQRRRDRHV